MADSQNKKLIYQKLREFFKGKNARYEAKGFIPNIRSSDVRNFFTDAEKQRITEKISNKNWENELSDFEKEERKILQEILGQHSFYKTHQSPSIRIGLGSSPLNTEYLGHHLERDVRKHGLEKALEDLKHLFEAETHEMLLVAIIAGVTTEKIIQINDQITIVPLTEVPKAGILKHFFEGLESDDLNRRHPVAYSATMPDRHKFLSQQRCAIIYKYGEVPLYEQCSREQILEISQKREELESIAHGLAAVQECAPIIEIRGEISSDDIVNRYGISGGQLESPKFIPFDFPKSENLDAQKTKTLISSYIDLDEGTLKDKVRLALQLIVHAQLVNGMEEQVMGYGMAWECLFQNSSADFKKDKLSQRAAHILHPESSEEYLATKIVLQSFYNLRSDIVHKGRVDGQKQYSGIVAYELINKVTPYFHEIIKRIVEYGTIPDWSRINLE